ncbi:hypothetical protein [Niabella ginsenosidivorans]|uniref:hypothetical protein n=1 Tax=Niabella ginsenosidivorans TaxID=1176587 RepID=UPI0012ECCDE5|nr:hypothetical protein [Niabella ginsenosidivorans]
MKIAGNLKYFIPLFILLSVDLFLIIMDLINFYHPFPDPKIFDIGLNESYAETYQNFKWILMIIALLMLALFRKEKRYFTWILVFIVLFLEDVFRVHDVMANALCSAFQLDSQRSEKIIELVLALFLGIVFLTPVYRAYKSGDATFRKYSKATFILLLLFLFCAVILDQVHRLSVVEYNWKYNAAFGMFEDGGELITESCLTGYLLSIAFKQQASI